MKKKVTPTKMTLVRIRMMLSHIWFCFELFPEPPTTSVSIISSAMIAITICQLGCRVK